MTKLDDLIARAIAEDDMEASEPATRESIAQLAAALQVRLPRSYERFLAKYGKLFYRGVSVSGIYENQPLLPDIGCAYGDTMRCRENFQLPPSYVVVEYDDDGESLFCLVTDRMDESGECPVVFYNIFAGKSEPAAKTFDEWLTEYLEIALSENG